MLPERSMTMAIATASLRCSVRSSIDTGSRSSTGDWKYPPEPKRLLAARHQQAAALHAHVEVERGEEIRRQLVRRARC